jgi:glutathione S-transferase
MVMHYSGMDYEDESYVQSPSSVWEDKKFDLGLKFPNLPYFIDADLKLTKSNAILRHLGRVNNLYGINSNESSTIDMLVDTASEMHIGLPAKMKQASEFLADKKFFMADNVTIADFIFFYVINWYLKRQECPQVH